MCREDGVWLSIDTKRKLEDKRVNRTCENSTLKALWASFEDKVSPAGWEDREGRDGLGLVDSNTVSIDTTNSLNIPMSKTHSADVCRKSV